MKEQDECYRGLATRRSFVKNGLAMAGTATLAVGCLSNGLPALVDEECESSGRLTEGDGAILRFFAAPEIIESDLCLQYAELGGP